MLQGKLLKQGPILCGSHVEKRPRWPIQSPKEVRKRKAIGYEERLDQIFCQVYLSVAVTNAINRPPFDCSKLHTSQTQGE